MLKISFYITPIDNTISGFELGGIEIFHNENIISSKNKFPDQSMMIFISISDLLEGIISISKNKKQQFRFIGTDSSFIINFEISNKYIFLESLDEKIKIEYDIFIENLYNSSLLFYEKYVKEIGYNDSVMVDLQNSLIRYKNELM